MGLDVFNVRAILSGSVTGTESFDRFGSKLNTVGKTADTVNKQMNGLSRSMNALMGGLAGFSLANVIAEFARVTIQIDAYQKQLSIGFGAASTLQLEQLRKTFRNLGISQDEALGSAVRFTSALKMSGNTSAMVNKNLEASSKIILANKLSADGANRVYYALAQVSSKGQLMTEELSGQLAENLAGIREQVAIALGLSSKALMEQMKEGKISAEQFFAALRKIGDGIDPATLNSAAQSLGKLKNAWFDFKTSVLAVDSIKAALDLTASAIMVLTNNADFLKRSVVLLAQALSALLIFRAVAAAAVFLNTAIWALQFSINLYGLKTTIAVNTTLALNRATKLLGLSAGPVGWAMTAAALAFGYFASGASKSEAASSALSASQQSMSNVIDMTTGKIISQDRALVEHNRLLAVAALKTNELAAAQARSQAESLFSPVAAQRSGLSVGAAGSEAEKGLAEAQKQFQQSVASGSPDIIRYKTAIEKLTEKYPALKSYIGDTNELFTRLLGTQRELEKSQLGVAMATGKLTEAQRTQAQALGLLFDESTGGSIKDGPKFPEAEGAIRGMQLQTALIAMSEKNRFVTEKLNEAKLVSFDATGKLIVSQTEFTQKIQEGAAALYEAEEAQKKDNKAKTDANNLAQSVASQLQSMGASNAQLKTQIDTWAAISDAVGKSKVALMQYETTQGQYAAASAKEKADLMAAAQLTDQYTAAIERLNEAKKMGDAATSMDKDIAKLRFKIQYFNQYGEAVDSSREAMALFDTTEGEFRNATEAEKKALIERARGIDNLTQSYNNLVAASKSTMMREGFQESASNRVLDVRQRALSGGSKKDRERSEFGQSLDKAIESARREAIRAGMANSDLQNLMAGLAQDRAQAMKDFENALTELDKREGNWVFGAKDAIDEYYDQIQDVAGSIKNAFTNAFQSAEDALVNFVMTGKLSFKDFARSIIADLARIAIQQAIMKPLMGVLKAQSWFPSADGSAWSGGTLERFASGGIVSSPTAFRHSGGMGLMGEAGPEAIMPLRRLSNGRLGVESSGGGSQNVTVNVSVENGGQKMSGDGGGNAKDLGKAIANVVRQELLAQKRPGGMLAA